MSAPVTTHQPSELLRFLTCGSVDDGKSTLIGRLLFDSKLIFEDQLAALERASHLRGEGEINLANLTDGLRSEREQGITIDVAYRFFSTPKRKFIVADCPGHIQYTRNMVTGASTANLAVILVDARKGIIEQTRRHSYLAALLGIPHMVLAVNKMDLVDYQEEVFERIAGEFRDFATHLGVQDITFIPISALNGDNCVTRSENMPWYQGTSILNHLESVHIASDQNLVDPRFPVQYVIRPRSDEFHDYRGYAGEISSGIFRKGDGIVVLPSGKRSVIKEIRSFDQSLDMAFAPMAVTLLLEDELDISRGDVIVPDNRLPYQSQDIDAMVCWMDEKAPLVPGKKYVIKHNTNVTKAMVRSLEFRVHVEDTESLSAVDPSHEGANHVVEDALGKDSEARGLKLNEIGRIKMRTQQPLIYDPYRHNKGTGAFVIIDEQSNITVGAGMIRPPEQVPPAPYIYDDYVI
jgi:bifunctional enzyme CysN/CysC